MQFPWSAVVGQESLKRALLLCAIDPAIGGVLVSGPRGVAKTTLARALAELVPGQFVELPLGATEERVTGAIDLERALQDGRVEFAPGLLARAHEGVLYVDEVNLLPDALVDLLLDAAATGRNVVERDGVSHMHPARFVLVGSMNPEEGELRPQLIDRFGLSASAEGAILPPERAQIVMRRLEFDRDPQAFRAKYAAEQQALLERCRRARELAAQIELGGSALVRVTERCHAAGVEGVRADLAMLRAARANAAWNGRAEITNDDVDAVAELALAHRRPRSSDPSGGDGGRGGSNRPGGAGQSPDRANSRAAQGGAGAQPLQRQSASAMDGGAQREMGFAERDPCVSNFADAQDGEQPEPRSLSSEHDASSPSQEGTGGAMRARPVRAARLVELPRWLTKANGRSAARYRRGTASAAAISGVRGRAAHATGTLDWFATLCAAARASERRDVGPTRAAGSSGSLNRDAVSHARSAGSTAPDSPRAGLVKPRTPHVSSRGSKGAASSSLRDALKTAGSSHLGAEEDASSRSRSPELRSLPGIAEPSAVATARGACPAQAASPARGPRIHVMRDQVRYRSRRRPSAQLWILAVDCSSSMLRSGGLGLAKGFAQLIEVGARRAGARLAVISFRGQGAQIEVDSSPGRAVLPLAIAAMGGGGGTPLRAALAAAGSLCKQSRWRNTSVFKRLLVLTDGRVHDPASLIPPLPSDLDRVVVDCELGRVRLGRTQQLMAALHASYYRPAQT